MSWTVGWTTHIGFPVKFPALLCGAVFPLEDLLNVDVGLLGLLDWPVRSADGEDRQRGKLGRDAGDPAEDLPVKDSVG